MSMSVDVEFGDKLRHLRFDLEAVEAFEAANGGQALGDLVGKLNNVGVTVIKYALWAALKHEDQALTPNLVRKMLQAHIDARKPMSDLTEPLNAAILKSGLFGKVDLPNETPEATTTS